MTNVVAAAALAFAASTGQLQYADIVCTNAALFDAWRYVDVRNRVTVPHAVTCSSCGCVSTNDVDVTDVYWSLKDKLSIEMRCEQDALRMMRLEAARLANSSSDAYRDGQAHALTKVRDILRGVAAGDTGGGRLSVRDAVSTVADAIDIVLKGAGSAEDVK